MEDKLNKIKDYLIETIKRWLIVKPEIECKRKIKYKRKIEVFLKNGDSINIVINDNYNIDECLKNLPYTSNIKLETDDKKIKYSILTNNISYIKTELIEEEEI